ncbi:MAG: ExeA family protein [Candidatus Brocadiia bacterium]
MELYSALGLEQEPFSTTADPAFMYASAEHREALLRLQLSLRQRRGLNVVVGDIGVGKTTLCRKLYAEIAHQDDYHIRIIDDPSFRSEYQFIAFLLHTFGVRRRGRSAYDLKECFRTFLIEMAEQDQTVILLVDEGQVLVSPVLEMVRMFLNFETDKYKLLQLVVFAQLELLDKLRRRRNFLDRIALRYVLNPLQEHEVAEMIAFRLAVAGYRGEQALFTPDAVEAIYEHTGGLPRPITMLCHNALETLVLNELPVVDRELVERCVEREAVFAAGA